MIASDDDYRERLHRHYEAWKGSSMTRGIQTTRRFAPSSTTIPTISLLPIATRCLAAAKPQKSK
jgi:hypothetical protein